jgi:hypothetical protein
MISELGCLLGVVEAYIPSEGFGHVKIDLGVGRGACEE